MKNKYCAYLPNIQTSELGLCLAPSKVKKTHKGSIIFFFYASKLNENKKFIYLFKHLKIIKILKSASCNIQMYLLNFYTVKIFD